MDMDRNEGIGYDINWRIKGGDMDYVKISGIKEGTAIIYKF